LNFDFSRRFCAEKMQLLTLYLSSNVIKKGVLKRFLKVKKLSLLTLAELNHFWWSRRESNSRPEKAMPYLLHA